MPDDLTIRIPLDELELFVHQSRVDFDEEHIRRLAENIRLNGQLQPGVAWLDPGRNRPVLICGELRYRALRLAGIKEMEVKLLSGTLTPGKMLQVNLAENIQRASLNPIERGKAFRRLMQLENLTASEVATRMQVSNAMVSRDFAMLELPESLQAKVASGELPASVAAHIARVTDDDTRRELADRYGSGLLTRDGIAAEVKLLEKSRQVKRSARLVMKFGGMSLSLGRSDRPATWEELLHALDRIKQEAKKLKERGGDIAALADVLAAS